MTYATYNTMNDACSSDKRGFPELIFKKKKMDYFPMFDFGDMKWGGTETT